jgi:hypothetical protein
MFFPEVLSAQGVTIPLKEMENLRLESPIENKHVGQGGSPGPSGSGSGPKIKKEEISELEAIMIVAKRIQAFQVSQVQGVAGVCFLRVSPDALARSIS